MPNTADQTEFLSLYIEKLFDLNTLQGMQEWIRRFAYYRDRREFEACQVLLQTVKQFPLPKRQMATVRHYEGVLHHLQKQFDESIRFYELALELLPNSENRYQAHILACTGVVFAEQGFCKEALELYKMSHDMHKDIDDDLFFADLLINMGNIHNLTGEFSQARTYYQNAWDRCKNLRSRVRQIAILTNLGEISRLEGTLDQARAHAENALAICQEIGDSHGRANIHNNLGIIALAGRLWQNAINHHQQSLAICNETGDLQVMAQALNNLGEVYRERGEFVTAIDYYQNSEQIADEIGDYRIRVRIFNNIGISLYELKEWDEASHYIDKALQLSRLMEYREGEAVCYQNLGALKESTKDHTAARDYVARVLFNLGSIFSEQKEYDQALLYYYSSQEILGKLGHKFHEARVWMNISSALLAKGEREQAHEILLRSLDQFGEVEDTEGQCKAIQLLAEINSEDKKYDDAIEWYSKLLEIQRQQNVREAIGETFDDLGDVYLRACLEIK